MKKLTLNKKNTTNILCYIVPIAFYIIMTILSSNGMLKSAMQGMLVPICVYVVAALSLNLTVGILGELSLGHAGFMSVGAFFGVSVGKILASNDMPKTLVLIISIIVGALAGALFGFLIGIPVLRLNGDYLAIVSLAFGEIIMSIFTNVYFAIDKNGAHFSILKSFDEKGLTLADDALVIINGPMGIKNIPRYSTFLAGTILIIITLIVILNLVNSRTGRSIMAIRDNKIAAESVGVDVTKLKMVAFTISAALAGAAGTLYGLNYSTCTADKFGFDKSILILVFVVLGGQGNMLGSIIAAAALTILPEALRQFSDYRMLVYAVVLIIVMLVTYNEKFQTAIHNLSAKMKGAKDGTK